MKSTTPQRIAWAAIIAAVIIVVSTHAQTPALARNPAWPQMAVADPATLGVTKAGLEALDARMKQAIADSDTFGMTYILIRHGQVADFKTIGRATPDKPMALDSLFRIYSMSKPITGVAMMQLYEQGKWKLDDPVTKYVPELASLKELTWTPTARSPMGGRQARARVAKTAPTMRELMSHTAGFGYGLAVRQRPGERSLPRRRPSWRRATSTR